MACPACGCKETYCFDEDDDFCSVPDSGYERCSACGVIFDTEDHAEEDDDHEEPARVEVHLSICSSQDDTMAGYPDCDCKAAV